jgi:hypothetical protein
VTLSPEEVREQNEINATLPVVVEENKSLKRENRQLRTADDEHQAEAASQAKRADAADARATVTQTQLDDCGKALKASERRGFLGKLGAVFKTAPLAFTAGAAVGSVLVLAAVLSSN